MSEVVWARYDTRQRADFAAEEQDDSERFAVRFWPNWKYPDEPWALVYLSWPPPPEPEREDAPW